MSIAKSEDMDDINKLRHLDPEDLTPRQLRKILFGHRRHQMARHMKSDEEKEKQDAAADEERESLADLMAEKGDGKPPKVSKDDLPGKSKDDDEDEDDKEES